MRVWEPQAAAAIVGLAAFELWKAWNENAPSLAEVRAARPDDIPTRQRLMDAEITVGGLAVIIGLSYAALTKDLTVLVILLVVLAALTFFHYWTLDADSVKD